MKLDFTPETFLFSNNPFTPSENPIIPLILLKSISLVVLLILCSSQIHAQENHDTINLVNIEAKLNNNGNKLKLTFQENELESYSIMENKPKCKKFVKPCPGSTKSHMSDSISWRIELLESVGNNKTFLISGPKDGELIINNSNSSPINAREVTIDNGHAWEVDIHTDNDSLETVFDIVPLVPNPKSGCWIYGPCKD